MRMNPLTSSDPVEQLPVVDDDDDDEKSPHIGYSIASLGIRCIVWEAAPCRSCDRPAVRKVIPEGRCVGHCA